MRNESRERELETVLFGLYEQWWHELEPDWRTDKFWQMIDPQCRNYKGGVWTIRHLLYSNDADSFIKPQEQPNMTVESLVLSGDWDDIFDDYDKLAAKKKLSKLAK